MTVADEDGIGFPFRPPEWHDETPSTNDILKERVRAGEQVANGTVIAARRQTRGKGRMGGVWVSARDGDLTFSFYRQGDRAGLNLGSLPMACALAVRDFLAMPPWGIRTWCKWPNDVLTRDGKICGILAEGVALPAGSMGLVVGIGVNLRRMPGRDDLLGRATATVEDAVGHDGVGEVTALLPRLLTSLSRRIGRWEEGGFAALRPDLEEAFWGRGKTVIAKTPDGPVHGEVVGMGDSGELLLKNTCGRVVGVPSIHALDGWDER